MKTVHAAPPKKLKTQRNQSTCRAEIPHVAAAKTAVAPDTILSTESAALARCNTIAPATAPTPKQPSSKPYPSELPVRFFATAGSSAQKALAKKITQAERTSNLRISGE